MNFAHKCNSMQVKHGSFTWSSLIFFFLRKPQIRQISLSSSLFIPCWMRMNYDLLLQIFEYLMLPLLLRLTVHSKPFQVLLFTECYFYCLSVVKLMMSLQNFSSSLKFTLGSLKIVVKVQVSDEKSEEQ